MQLLNVTVQKCPDLEEVYYCEGYFDKGCKESAYIKRLPETGRAYEVKKDTLERIGGTYSEFDWCVFSVLHKKIKND
ncbi:hypothetical protein [Macrococcus armenti]|uniref:hypothetical protein n=1 Tax=Macrococcus armenti TaxID=2875764 RepID=UPI001CCF1387|nr:hypothetical protein [Macrococcus armenti]UBH13588.1 hypothetical protein LAU43_02545 [Macrococcus armenti]